MSCNIVLYVREFSIMSHGIQSLAYTRIRHGLKVIETLSLVEMFAFTCVCINAVYKPFIMWTLW